MELVQSRLYRIYRTTNLTEYGDQEIVYMDTMRKLIPNTTDIFILFLIRVLKKIWTVREPAPSAKLSYNRTIHLTESVHAMRMLILNTTTVFILFLICILKKFEQTVNELVQSIKTNYRRTTSLTEYFDQEIVCVYEKVTFSTQMIF